MWKVVRTISFAFIALQESTASPISGVGESGVELDIYNPNQCYLPSDLNYNGDYVNFEDCENLHVFHKLPIFGENGGLSWPPHVCCPGNVDLEAPCLPTDPHCSSYEYADYSALVDVDGDNEDYLSDEDYLNKDTKPAIAPTSYDIQGAPNLLGGQEECSRFNGSNCISVLRCDLFEEYTPLTMPSITDLCGFDDTDSALMVCCPPDRILTDPIPTPKPRYPLKGGSEDDAYACEDQVEMCSTWKENGACQLGHKFHPQYKDPDFWEEIVPVEMMNFMTAACLGSCNRCGKKGCRDDLPKCKDWARHGHCLQSPFFMMMACRESCGNCGFLSPYSKEEQVVNNRSYTSFDDEDFFCGKFKSKEDLKAEGVRVDENLRASNISIINSMAYCGAAIINDRWMITAAHCVSTADPTASERVVQTIRKEYPDFAEQIGTRRLYKHPGFRNNELYDDIALIELDRRIEMDYDKFGDSAYCLDPGFNLDGKTGSALGFGSDEEGEHTNLLAINTTLLTHDHCAVNMTRTFELERAKGKSSQVKLDDDLRKLCSKLSKGFNQGQLCSYGDVVDRNGRHVRTGHCNGDSGGPLYYQNNGTQYIAGIVSDALGCNSVFPQWYAKVYAYRFWIECIIEASSTRGRSKKHQISMDRIQKTCAPASFPRPDQPWQLCASINV